MAAAFDADPDFDHLRANGVVEITRQDVVEWHSGLVSSLSEYLPSSSTAALDAVTVSCSHRDMGYVAGRTGFGNADLDSRTAAICCFDRNCHASGVRGCHESATLRLDDDRRVAVISRSGDD